MNNIFWIIKYNIYLSVILLAGVLTSPTVYSSDSHDREGPGFYRNYYYPGTEVLALDEMRITALGTGVPVLRKSQASASWFVELGNGEKFFFDVGAGSQSNFPMLEVSYADADKVFLSHLHVDHAGDLDILWISGWLSGRFYKPLQVWGPSSTTSKLGTKYFVDGLRQTWHWDMANRQGRLPAAGAEIKVHEFDYSHTNIIYEKNDVKITAIPAVHGIDGPVSYKLEWNGLSFAYSGDTTPNNFFIENTKSVDVMVHETQMTADQMVKYFGMEKVATKYFSEAIHTSPVAGGKIFRKNKPRLAVAYHFFNDFHAVFHIYDDIRSSYRGPLVLANDGLVINVTKEEIKIRQLTGPKDTYREVFDAKTYIKAKRKDKLPMSKWLRESILFRSESIAPMEE